MSLRAITAQDVANLAQVSLSTVSRILRAKPGEEIPFSIQTQEKVRKAAEKLGYRPSKLARGLARARTGIVGLIIPSLEDSFFPSVTAFAQERLARDDIHVLLASTNGDSIAERARIEDFLSWRVDGLIIAPAQGVGDAEIYWRLWREKAPFVLIDRVFQDTPFFAVTGDDTTGASMVIDHLVSLGRTRIARIGTSQLLSTDRLRYAACRDSLLRYGIALDDELVMDIPPTNTGGCEAVRRLMRLDNPPTALFFFNEEAAIGAMDECLKEGIRIPHDVALVGYGDLAHSRLLRVPLTTVRQPGNLIGECAAEMLMAQIEGHPPPETLRQLPVQLMIRESTVVV